MSLIQLNNIYKEFSGELLLNNISFNINEQDRIGIIGLNGSGKSTLIKILLGIEDFDANPITNKVGSIVSKQNLKIGYLSQDSKLDESNNVFEELIDIYNLKEEYVQIQKLSDSSYNQQNLSEDEQNKLLELVDKYEQKEGYTVENNIKQTLYGLGLDENLWYRKIAMLSGGQKTSVALAKALLQEPDLLIMDEPTNHLDINAIEWLENLLKSYNKAVMIISHDTCFLDNTVTTIFEIENKKLNTYSGNYSDYVIQKQIYLSGALKAYNKQQDQIAKLEEFVRKYKAGQKSKQARGRQKMLDNMEKAENPVIPIRKIKLKMQVEIASGMQVLRLENLAKAFNENVLFNNLNIEILKGNRIGLIGKNGVGKSTILKIIEGLVKQDSGNIIFGEKLKIAYYDQNHNNIDRRNTILEEIRNNFDITEEQARNIAGSFLFTRDDVNKLIGSLSGGERARVSLIKLILSKPNFLIMDEPTNHLDIFSKEILEEALDGYQGTILLVSHDRHFLEAIVDKIYVISHEGAMVFNGNYQEYVQSKNSKTFKNYQQDKQNDRKDKNSKNNDKTLENKNATQSIKAEVISGLESANSSSRDIPKGEVVKAKLSYDERKKLNNKISILQRQIDGEQAKISQLQQKEIELYKKCDSESNEEILNKIQEEIDSIYFQTIDIQNKVAILNSEMEDLKKLL